VIVAVCTVLVVQVSTHEVIGVIAMWHGFVSTARTVRVSHSVAAAGMSRRALRGVVAPHANHVLVDVITMHMVKTAVVQVVDVISVSHGNMPAGGVMLMGMTFVCRAAHCGSSGRILFD
jgi:hypothetical protein